MDIVKNNYKINQINRLEYWSISDMELKYLSEL